MKHRKPKHPFQLIQGGQQAEAHGPLPPPT